MEHAAEDSANDWPTRGAVNVPPGAGTPDDRPWWSQYGLGQPHGLALEAETALEMFRAAVLRSPDHVAVRYFDGALTLEQLDAHSDALAVALQTGGFFAGDRLAIYLQNVPQWLIALLGAWKAGGVAVAVNPMNRERELDYLLRDSGASVLVCHPGLHDLVARSVVPDTAVTRVLTTSELDFQERDDPRVLGGVTQETPEGTEDLRALLHAHAGALPEPVALSADDVAILTYTSGTTGVPKGAMNTHRNIVFTSQTYRDWIELDQGDVVLGAAPLFHITGLIGHIGLCLQLPATLVLTYRFEPAVMRDAVIEHRPTFVVMAITAFGAWMKLDGASPTDFSSLRKGYSGGAAVPPAMRDLVREQLGLEVHQAYGLTETTSPSHMQPLNSKARVDEVSGALSVGVPVYDTVVRIVDEQGTELPAGEVGEIEIEGPQVIPGYWGKPEESAESLPGGRLRTGDVGLMSPTGWFFIVDRKKDMINASGYKVWPREVEDVLYTHSAVREAAVVGAPHEYRGETVRAFVSLRKGTSTTPEELITYCRERMAAYKYPREVVLVDDSRRPSPARSCDAT